MFTLCQFSDCYKLKFWPFLTNCSFQGHDSSSLILLNSISISTCFLWSYSTTEERTGAGLRQDDVIIQHSIAISLTLRCFRAPHHESWKISSVLWYNVDRDLHLVKTYKSSTEPSVKSAIILMRRRPPVLPPQHLPSTLCLLSRSW